MGVLSGQFVLTCLIHSSIVVDINPKPYTLKTHISRRETEVLHLIAHEFTTLEIADKLFISYSTVHSHRKSMLNKLQVKNSAGLIRRAFELGLLKIDRTSSMNTIAHMSKAAG